MKVLWVTIAFLCFAIPTPSFAQSRPLPVFITGELTESPWTKFFKSLHIDSLGTNSNIAGRTYDLFGLHSSPFSMGRLHFWVMPGFTALFEPDPEENGKRKLKLQWSYGLDVYLLDFPIGGRDRMEMFLTIKKVWGQQKDQMSADELNSQKDIVGISFSVK